MKQKRPRASQFILEDRLTPPTYQVELVCSALKNNIVLCVSNDNGLPFVPIMLIKCMYEQMAANKSSHRISVYLSPHSLSENRKCLVSPLFETRNQPNDCLTLLDDGSCELNAQRIRMHSTLRVSVVTDDSCKISDVVGPSDVVCMSADRCLQLLQNNSLAFSQINLMIFDECHVAVEKNSSYANVVSLLKHSPCFDSVRLFGMTSSIIGGACEEPEELEWKISQLESVLASTAETMSDLNVMDTLAVKREEIIAAYDDSDKRAHSLTEDIRVTLRHAYHFLGDMVISQGDVVRAREEMVVKKGRAKIAAVLDITRPAVVEPLEDSVEWYNLQLFKEAPRKVFTEIEATLDELGPWCAGCVAHNLCSTLEKIIEKTGERIEKQLLQLAWTQLRYIHMLVKQASEAIEDYTELLDLSTPKVRQLIEILKSYLPKVDFEITSAISSHNRSLDFSDYSDFSDLSDGESTQDQETFTIAKMKNCGEQDHVVKVNQEETTLNGLIFVNRKHAAYALHKYIEDLCVWDQDMYFIRSSYMIGDGEDGNDGQGRNKKQEQRLVQFRQHKVNLLVGTNVLESNLDLPKCNLICMFDRPQSYHSYIKTKSRAKAFNAKYYTICSTEEEEFFEKYMGDFRKVEMILQSKCHEFNRSNTISSHPTVQHEGDEVLVQLPPFVAPGTEATVTVNNAIGLLNRYCAKLPSDIYTRLTPTSTIRAVDNGYQATIQLPVNCRLKHTITGQVMPTEQMAIAAAALHTCEELYKQGELDAHLAPIGKEYLRSPKQDAEWESESKSKHSKGIPGSSKRKQSYPKAIAEIFHEAVLPDQTCHLYVAKQTLTIPLDQDKHNRGRDVFITEQHPYTIGFLVQSKLPRVPEFPVFTRSGQESVTITYCKECRLSQKEYDQVLSYHAFVFHNVLRVDKFPLKVNTKRSKFNILIVPIEAGDNKVAWDYIESTLNKLEEWIERPPLFSRKTKNFVFRKEDFRDAVVMPSYRNQDQPEFFYVASLRSDLSPQSPFPSPDLYNTFYTYYTSKYGLEITNSSQPLLDVDRTSGRLNLMTPRFMNQKGMPLPTSSASSKKNKKLSTRERQILIPELCDIHPCSASTWRKLVCVPTIIYRMNSLLLSHQLLCRINRGMQLDCLSYTEVPSGEKLDLGVDFSLLSPSTTDPKGPSHSAPPTDSADYDLDKAAEELVSGLKDIYLSAEPVISSATDLDSSLSTEGSVTEEESEEEEDDGDDSIPIDLQMDKEEDSIGNSGPTVTMILHALTMSNASDFINLERLETVGDSFLKFAVTLYLFCAHPGLHEGRLSYGRGKQVSNFNLYLLGKKLGLQEYLMSEKFEPAENWLPPGYVVDEVQPIQELHANGKAPTKPTVVVVPYNLRTQHSLPDKSIADCVESLIGCYLTSCGPYAARVFMAWLGINVLPSRETSNSTDDPTPGNYLFSLPQPPPGLISSDVESQRQLDTLYSGLENFEDSIGYKFNDKAYLVQAFSHSSYVHNKVTDCYQRLEFLGDAVLDYVITRRLFEDKRKHSPGILTDLRSALVNNNVFAALAVKWDFHKYIKFISTQMYVSVHRFVQHQKGRQDRIQIEQYLRLSEGDDEGEEVEIPKVLGDVFESVAGAIYIDSNMSLDTLWRVYFPLMKQQIVQFSKRIPKSPVRELLEREPETAKFQKPERTKDGKARVSVTVAGKDTWWGVGRSYRIAKAAAAKKALIALNAMESAAQ